MILVYIYMCIVYRVCDSVSVCVYVYVCFIVSSLWFVFQMSPNKTKTNLMCVLSKEPYHRSLVEPTCIWIDYFTVAFLKSSEKRNHAAAALLLLFWWNTLLLEWISCARYIKISASCLICAITIRTILILILQVIQTWAW